MERPIRRVTEVITALAVAGMLGGCGITGPLAPPYNGTAVLPNTQMTPVANQKIKYALPPGWSAVPIDSVNPGVIIAAFQKDHTSVNGKILCNSAFLTRAKSGEVMREAVRATSGTATSAWGPFALGKSFAAPVVQEYEGTVTAKGQEKTLDFWIGYNVNSLSCQYGLLIVGTKADAAGLQRDVIAIMRSLK